jgi:eukaryotic-like serine/threonine-protein kinase
MNKVRWNRLQELFERLLERPPSERAAWLDENEPDASLREEALALVAKHDSGPDVLTARLREAADQVAAQPAAGLRLGPYVLIREIGSGGMGTVFLAERVDAEFDRLVAIKLIRGVPTLDASARLRRERQILADLSHPNIARLLDGGTTGTGQPYLVMEFIEGPSAGPADSATTELVKSAATITDYCRTANLPLHRRLRLLQQVCRAVHYAHQRLVIHRDLKPANVLVRNDGSPVLLDFGIAKLLDSEASGQQTQTGVPWFTPAYASPEQRGGSRISTATDVYALGVLMHELLVDQLAARDASGRLPALAGLRNADGERIADRELDIIVAKASHAEAERRYASAEALANDIERYLRGRPIQAAPDSFGYRAGKFVRRHRWALAAAAGVVVLSAFMLVRLAIENERARHAEQVATRESVTSNRVVEYLVSLFDAASPDKIGTRMIAPVELVDAGVREARSNLADQPGPRARLLFALGEIYFKLGKGEQAVAVIEEAVALERQQPDQEFLAHYLGSLGTALNSTERHGAAAEALREARRLLQARHNPDAGAMSEVLTSLSLAEARTGQIAVAIDDAKASIALATQVDGETGLRLGEANNALSEAYWRNNDLDAARVIAEANVRRMAEQHETGETVILAKTYLANILSDQGERERAEALLREVIDNRLQILDPGSDWIITLRNQLASVLRAEGRPLETTELLNQNLAAMQARGETNTPSYMIALNNLGAMQDQIGDFASAETSLREALRLAEAENDPASARPDIYRQSLGRVLMLAGKLDDARPFLEREISDDGSDDRRVARLRRLVHLAEWWRRKGNLDSATDFIGQAEANQLAVFGPEHLRAASVAHGKAAIARDRGDLGAAETLMQRALDVASKGFGDQANQVIEIRVELADIQLARGEHEQALANLEGSRDSVAAKFKPGSATPMLFATLHDRLVSGSGTRAKAARKRAS